MRRPHPIQSLRNLFGGVLTAVRDPQVQGTVSLTVAAITVAAVFYHLVEGWDPIDSVYFATVTIATVGYGDFTPQTDAGKIFTVGYVLVGIGLFVAAGAALADHILRRSRRLEQERLRAAREAGRAPGATEGDDPPETGPQQ